jgi:glutamyl-tRNA synthetase
MTTPVDPAVRVRFPPSPTGNPHVGLVRSALFNWAFARHHGGTLVLRIEDTDTVRSTEESYRGLLDALHWLGIDWDEGPEVGGPHEPYRQSERGPLYDEVRTRLVEGGYVYESFSTPAEVEARHRAAGRDPKLGYDNADRALTPDQVAAFRAEGRPGALRMRMPDTDLAWDDLVRGPISFAAGSVADFAITRANGEPLYTLTNPVDDAVMGITHVLRGEDLLPSTPRQLVLWQALIELGYAQSLPLFGHLPYVMGEGNKKLSKRDPTSSLDLYRQRGFLPEGLLNYLALLGWSIGGDREIFSLPEMAAAFDIDRVSANPARFDLKKAEAINAEWIRRLEPADFAARVLDRRRGSGLLAADADPAAVALVTAAAPLIQERITLLDEVDPMLGFLLIRGDDFAPEAADAAAVLGVASVQVLAAASDALSRLDEWSTAAIESALRAGLVEGLGLKPRVAFGPVRVAVTGRRISPPLFESIELLGRDETLARLATSRAIAAPAV